MKHYVYMLQCVNDTYYTGYTTDIQRRFEEHVNRNGKCRYTRSFPPVKLAAYWYFDDKSTALREEARIKKLSRQEKDKLIKTRARGQAIKTRCAWVTDDPVYIRYHDEEWGVPINDDRLLFEFLILEGAQAGLNWLTILKRRDNYRRCFDYFDAEKIACYDHHRVQKLLNDSGIIRNRLKIQSVITNAKAYLAIQKECGSFSDYIWQFVGGKPIQNHWKKHTDVPTTTAQSDTMSTDLKKRGFKFVGSTICYAYMQAVGMVNDHLVGCRIRPKI